VQLGALSLLTALGVKYMLATTLAVEAAVLHNFLWHEHFTWADRSQGRGYATTFRLVRFNATTGAVLIGGNLLLMRLLVGEAHLRPLLANLISIAGCSLVNFLVSDRWVFPGTALASGGTHGQSEWLRAPREAGHISGPSVCPSKRIHN